MTFFDESNMFSTRVHIKVHYNSGIAADIKMIGLLPY